MKVHLLCCYLFAENKTNIYLLGKSAGLILRSNEVEDVLNSWQSDQEDGPHGWGYRNHQMACWEQ